MQHIADASEVKGRVNQAKPSSQRVAKGVCFVNSLPIDLIRQLSANRMAFELAMSSKTSCNTKRKTHRRERRWALFESQSGRQDLNLRPRRPESGPARCTRTHSAEKPSVSTHHVASRCMPSHRIPVQIQYKSSTETPTHSSLTMPTLEASRSP